MTVDDIVVPLGESGHLHGGTVGNLLVQVAQQFLPDNLRHDLPLGLVGDHIVGEQLGSLGNPLGQQVQQFFHTLPGFGGNGHDGVPVVGGAIHGHHRQQLFLLDGVNLIDDQHGGGAQGLDAADELLFGGADAVHRLHQQHHAIHVRHGLAHHLHHVVAQTSAGLVQTGGVHKDELGVTPVEHRTDAVTGGLGLGGDNGDLLPHQGVGQGGLAHVGAAHDGDNSAFLDLRHSR